MTTLHTANKQITEPFAVPEQLIRSTFEHIISIATERRDELLAQLNKIKLEYTHKEKKRQKQLRELQMLIEQVLEASVHQNPIVEVQEEQMKKLKQEKKKYEQPITVPVPVLGTEGLQILLQQLETFGSIQNAAEIYTNKGNPVKTFGKGGTKKGEFKAPFGIALDGKQLYVTDLGNGRVQIFSMDGKFIKEFGYGKLAAPVSIALHGNSVFVSDFDEKRIFKFGQTNHELICRSSRKEIGRPTGMTADMNGEVLVADINSNSLLIFSSELQFIREIGKGRLKCPHDVKINLNQIFVADNNEINNVHIFSKSGDFLKSLIKLEKGTGYIFMCFDLHSYIVISDNLGNSIQIFTIDGKLIHRINCYENPNGIAVSSNFEIICALPKSNAINIY